MTPRSQSQPKADDDHGDRNGRKFMLVGIAAFLATAITMSAGLMLTNKAKAHLRKERLSFEHDQTNSFRSAGNSMVGIRTYLSLDLKAEDWPTMGIEHGRQIAEYGGPSHFNTGRSFIAATEAYALKENTPARQMMSTPI